MNGWLLLLAFGTPTATVPVATPDPPLEEAPPRPDRSYLGAAGPPLGRFVFHGALGVALVLPHFTLGVRAGLGAGFGLDVAYRNLAIFGQSPRARLMWGTAVADGIDLGVSARAAYTTLAPADGDLIDIDFSSTPLANDLEVGNDIALTFHRPGGAHITASIGPTFTLGGTRFIGFQETADGFVVDPALRGIEGAIQGEWRIWDTTNLIIRLDAIVLAGIEKDEACLEARQSDCFQVFPLGFIPTGTLGLGWSP